MLLALTSLFLDNTQILWKVIKSPVNSSQLDGRIVILVISILSKLECLSDY